MSRTFHITLQRKVWDLAVAVDATWNGEFRGEPGHWDIDVIRNQDGNVVDVTDDDRRFIQEELDETASEDFREYD